MIGGRSDGVSAFDPRVLVAVMASLALLGLVAVVIPARRAARVNPAIVLSD